MYHILETDSGQPIILWQSGNNLLKYTIQSGRIYNRGFIRRDINRNFKLWNTSPAYFSYESVDGSVVVCRMTADDISEVFTTKCLSSILCFSHKLAVFLLEPSDNTYQLCVTTSDDWDEKKAICGGIDLSESLYAVQSNDFIVLFLKNKQIFLSSDFKIISTIDMSAARDSNTINLQNEVSKLKFELHQLEQHHAAFLKEYDQLSDYAGELQEKLRKTRLNMKEQ